MGPGREIAERGERARLVAFVDRSGAQRLRVMAARRLPLSAEAPVPAWAGRHHPHQRSKARAEETTGWMTFSYAS